MSRYVETTTADGVATVTIDRSERHNSLVPALLEELLEALESVGGDDATRAVVLETAGASFSTGGDVRAFDEHRDEIGDYADRIVGHLNEAILALLDCPVPVVAAVDGQVTGGSLGLLLGADVVVCSPDATITPYYAVVGFSPDGGWTALLPDVIGEKRTARTLLENETIEPETAVAWGLATEVVPADEIHERALESARRIASMQPDSVERTKRLLGPDPDAIADRLERERREFVEQIETDEALAGMRAFLE